MQTGRMLTVPHRPRCWVHDASWGSRPTLEPFDIGTLTLWARGHCYHPFTMTTSRR